MFAIDVSDAHVLKFSEYICNVYGHVFYFEKINTSLYFCIWRYYFKIYFQKYFLLKYF